jgi:hypothetical protein
VVVFVIKGGMNMMYLNQPSPEFGIPKDVQRQLDENFKRKKKSEEAQIQSAEYLKGIKESQARIEEILENIFASGEDAVIVQKEIMKIMKENGVNENTIKDKGIDFLIQGVFTAIQFYLNSKGINV